MSRYFVSIFLILVLATGAMGADLIAQWPMDQNSGDEVKDVVGKFNGKIAGGKAVWVPAKFGNGLELTAPNHHVEVAKAKELELNTLTLIAWVNFKLVGGRQEVVSYADSFGIFAEGNFFRVLLFDGAAWKTVTGVTSIKQDTWYQTGLVVDQAEIRLYVNGKIDAKLATPPIKYQNFPMWFGGAPADNQFWMTGILDEVEIWNGVLKDAEIEKLYTAPPVIGAVEHADKLTITWGDVKSQ
jgi:hypothetical protein